MIDLVDLLLHSLSRKGLTPLDVKKLIKDVLCVLNDGDSITLSAVNWRLEGLGWDEEILDEDTFGLILCLLFHITKQNVGLYVEEPDHAFYET